MVERIAVGFLVGTFGFCAGMFCWLCLHAIPGFDLNVFYPLSLTLGATCFLLGLWRPEATIEWLGNVIKKAWNFSHEVLHWFTHLR